MAEPAALGLQPAAPPLNPARSVPSRIAVLEQGFIELRECCQSLKGRLSTLHARSAWRCCPTERVAAQRLNTAQKKARKLLRSSGSHATTATAAVAVLDASLAANRNSQTPLHSDSDTIYGPRFSGTVHFIQACEGGNLATLTMVARLVRAKALMLSGQAAEALEASRAVARELSPSSLGLHLYHEAHKITAHTALVIASSLAAARRLTSPVTPSLIDPSLDGPPVPVRFADDRFAAAAAELGASWVSGSVRPPSPQPFADGEWHDQSERSSRAAKNTSHSEGVGVALVGLVAVGQLLANPALDENPNELAEVLELKSELLLRACGCTGEPQRGQVPCACGAVVAACQALQASTDVEDAITRPGGNNRIPHLQRQARLRALKIQAGAIDLEAEAEAAAALTQIRLDRRDHSSRRRGRKLAAHTQRLNELAGGIAQRRRVVPLCEPRPEGAVEEEGTDTGSVDSLLAPKSLDWNCVPLQLQPGSDGDGGLAHDPTRVARKRLQLESLYRVLHRVICNVVTRSHAREKQSAVGAASKKCVVVDFGAGSGNSALVFAALFPHCHFILVDYNATAVKLGEQRVASAGLPNAEWWCGDVGEFRQPFDVGLATHLCGDATDVAIEMSVTQGASFIATPCCLGKVARTAAIADRDSLETNVEYPRSAWLRETLSRKTYLELIRLADYNSHTAVGTSVLAKQLVDADRMAFAQETGYHTCCAKFFPESASAKNDVLVGWQP